MDVGLKERIVVGQARWCDYCSQRKDEVVRRMERGEARRDDEIVRSQGGEVVDCRVVEDRDCCDYFGLNLDGVLDHLCCCGCFGPSQVGEDHHGSRLMGVGRVVEIVDGV